MKAYITGICGFVGSWLAEELLERGYKVRGAAIEGEPDQNIAHIRKAIKIDRFDITDGDACRKFIRKARPDYLFHLAAAASVGRSFSTGDSTFKTNVYGTHNILEAVRGQKWLRKMIFVSSSDVYGPVAAKDMPLKPNRRPNPISPYAQSKLAAEFIAAIYHNQYQVPVIIVRAFNHTGPRQSDSFVIPSFCRKIVAAERSPMIKTIGVGNLSVRRDILDVRDVVRGYRMLAEKGIAGDTYHLCSGKAELIKDILKRLISCSDTTITIRKDRTLYRKADIAILRGSYLGTKRTVGWKPKIALSQTLKDTLAYWRESEK